MSSFDLKSDSKGETKEPGFTTKDKNVIQNLSLKTAGKRRHNLDMIKVQVICSLLCNSDSVLATLYDLEVGNCDASPASLRRTAGLNQRRNHSDSNLNAVRQAKGGFCDVNQKLCDFAQKAARKRRIKESKLTLTGKIDSLSSSSSSGAEGNRKNFEKIVKVERVSPTYNEHSALPSLLGLQDRERREATKAPFDKNCPRLKR
ncbi:hypothetical protein CUMW_265710 [Citrus unshiu]|uniref:Uncharacterized protein n=1 Tax=Citrus unshiu TaxID=55188 RepID=A0A2H5QVJ3_CITUN|nr:hypothetical protein CUMW_265710 [Citrus unshiu]